MRQKVEMTEKQEKNIFYRRDCSTIPAGTKIKKARLSGYITGILVVCPGLNDGNWNYFW